ncbi:unnamed protein product [Spodoptera littoralis]|uniref:Replication factor C subunit 1 n=1 Tax=Spodoptera littoralis TaxID=7109 RepID=A0A9P0IAM3_SPOLI|nr:unnamed protein product [Spodoptera littoralis]CAH1643183.1 unnamed protein product [Spodoptera littoralis]
MSRDIRSFFQPKKPPKPAVTIDDDDDVIPESPDVQIIKNKKKESKKRRVIDDDSDEEIFSSKKKKNNDASSAKAGQTSSKNKSKSPKPALKEVKVIDMFGNDPIKRTEPLVKKKKKTELGIHSDDEFEKSLLEIDNAELEANINNDKVTNDEKPKSSAEKGDKAKSDESKESKHKTDESKESKHQTDESKESKHKSNESKESRHKNDESRHKSDDGKAKKHTKDDKKPNQSTSHSNDSETKKSKIENSKRKFAEFIDGDSSDHGSKKKKIDEQEKESKHKYDGNSSVMDESMEASRKRNMNKSLNESALTDEERHERRMHSAALYKNYLNRSGPKHLGAKEIPEGKPDCLKDCAFLLTGVLDSFEKDEVTHVIAGEDAGPAKMAKAQELGIKIINEDEFLKMIVDRSRDNTSKPETKKEIKREKTPSKSKSKSPKDKKDNHVDKLKSPDRSKSESKVRDKSNDSKHRDISSPKKIKAEKVEASSSSNTARNQVNTSLRLMNWLTKWYVNRKAKLPKPSPWAKNDDGGYYKAALLSGPPGVGKTTSVALVCKELGFDMVEFNASDTRNKTLIKEQIGQLLTTNSLSGFANGVTGKQAVTKKHVLVMDEVDGMAGNEDRDFHTPKPSRNNTSIVFPGSNDDPKITISQPNLDMQNVVKIPIPLNQDSSKNTSPKSVLSQPDSRKCPKETGEIFIFSDNQGQETKPHNVIQQIIYHINAMYSSVIPGNRMSGHMTGQIQFPAWLGKNSRATKMKRLCQEIHAHTRLSTSGSKSSIYLDYSMHLRNAILNPLVKDKLDGVDKSLEVLESYNLLREDLDSLVELSVWPGQMNPADLVESRKKKSKDTEKPTTSKGKSTSKASTGKKKKEK